MQVCEKKKPIYLALSTQTDKKGSFMYICGAKFVTSAMESFPYLFDRREGQVNE